MIVVVLFVVTAWSMWRGFRLYRRGSVAAVLPNGLFVRPYGKPGKLYEWELLSAPQTNWTLGNIAIKRRDSALPLLVADVFKGRADAERMVKQIQERIPAGEVAGEPSAESPDEAYARWCAEQGFKRAE